MDEPLSLNHSSNNKRATLTSSRASNSSSAQRKSYKKTGNDLDQMMLGLGMGGMNDSNHLNPSSAYTAPYQNNNYQNNNYGNSLGVNRGQNYG